MSTPTGARRRPGCRSRAAPAACAAARRCSSTTAAPMPAGSRRRTRQPCRSAVRGSARRSSRARPWPPSAPGAPMRACTPSGRSSISTPRRGARRAPGCSGPTPACRRHRAAVGGRSCRRTFTRATAPLRRIYRYYILNSQRPLGAAAPARAAWIHRRARRRCHAAAPRRRSSGEHDFSRLPLGRVPVEVADAPRRAHRACARDGDCICASRSRRMPSCTTWCATSSARCSTVQSER